jgi:ABC-2 type transport system ATP-binding protein
MSVVPAALAAPRPGGSRMSVVTVENLSKRYGEFTAVDSISFEVQAGEVFGFLGPNGAGKTTTISVLCTLLRLSGGRAKVAGFDVEHEPDQVRRAIGLIFQDPTLDVQLTAQENLNFHAAVYDVPGAEARARGEQLLRMVELWDRRNDLVRTFSGGMRRRLEIARGLLHSPRVLFLDEPTIGLDPQTRRHIWDYILGLRRQEELTLFLTTHYMDEAEYCDRIAIIDHGTIVAVDTPSNLKAMVGGDVITLRTEDNERAAEEIGRRFEIEVQRQDGQLHLEVERGEEFVPTLARELSVPINAISLNRPTLDDVFLKLTGRAIREEEASGQEAMRTFARAWSGGRR